MKDRKEKIDLLFERNAAEQLSRVDWDELSSVISRRLDEAEAGKAPTRKHISVFKIAAGVAAAAAVVIIAVMIKTEAPAELQLEEGQRAVVKLIESKASASVEIIDLNGDLGKKDEQGSWIIISKPVPMYADNGLSKDLMSMICLF